MYSLVLVFYGLAGPCIRNCGQKRGNGQDAYQALGRTRNCTRVVIERTMVKQPETRFVLEPRKQRSYAFAIECETHD
jgi:hypothetical protein